MKIQKKKIAAPVSNFVFENKQAPYGVYRQRVVDTSTNKWDGNKGWWSPRRWQRKAWIFLGAYTADVAVGFALVDAGYLAKAFCYVYQRSSGQYWENEYSRPWGFGKNFQAALEEPWQLGPYRADFQAGKGQLSYQHKDVQLALSFQETPQGLSSICPSQAKRPFHYTYKNLLLPSTIHFQHPEGNYYNSKALSSLDYSKGYPPRHTRWNWTSFMGQLDNGTPVGINTVRGFNQDLENALWVGDTVQRLGSMQYYCPQNPLQEVWRVHSEQEEQLFLELKPDGLRQENINLGILKSQFKQVFGVIEGRLYHQEQWQNLQGYGLMEDHNALW